jgi:asparagine synthase (glutamine-hydrolysing)
MPGIAGIITKGLQEQNKVDLRLMTDSLKHESFYNYGNYINEHLGIYLGWVCHKDSFVDCMPIWNENQDKCLLFYGENFTERDTIEGLKENGHNFNPDNASYLIHLFEEEGEDCFAHLNGFFNGILIDLSRSEAILFNDRYGMQRVYYYENKSRFIFSSEAKALLKVCPELREIVPASLGQLLSIGCVLGNNSLFKNVYLLPAGSLFKFKNGICEKKEVYFNRRNWEAQAPLGKETFYGELKKTFVKILGRYLRSSRAIGMSLTGGLDTRMIMAHARRLPETFPCYTFGSMYRDSFDVKVARKVAGVCKQNHFTIKVDKTFLSQFAYLAEKAIYITDGYLDAASGAAELYINKKGREIAPIRITGNYGSEVLRSIRGFGYKAPDGNLFDGEINKHVLDAYETFVEAAKEHNLSFFVFKQAPWFNYNRACLEQSQLTMRTPFMDNDLVGLVYRAPQEAVSNDDMSLELVKDGNVELSKIITNRGVGGNSSHFVSTAKQHCHEMLRLAELCYDYCMPQWFSRLDYYLTPFHLERWILGRDKFCHFRIWFRDELSNYIKEMLLDTSSLNRPYLNKKFIEGMVINHIKGRANYTTEINKVLTFELIQRFLLLEK